MVDDNERGFRRALIEASAHFGLDHERLEQLGGMTGRVFGIDDVVLRLGSPETIAHELAAANAASVAVPVPATVGTFVPTDGGPWAAALIERVDGTVAADLSGLTADRAFTRGLACGRAQAALWTVTAPPAFASIDGERSLLHLDLHPLNILLGSDDRVTAVIDWTNAAAGSPDYDRARTSAIFRLDPHVTPLLDQPVWRAFLAGWTDGANLDEASTAARIWACRFMLHDLQHRHPGDALDHVRHELEVLEEGRPRPAITEDMIEG
ncbi:phosphotransferase [Plantibacter sp. M259]|uniref:phosphotransferase n=1 Tax=Plantibacter sp. M259 TaxID=2583822 RepID=UPI001110B779|nr:phosphotransferase [Plantibacter sp. M259]